MPCPLHAAHPPPEPSGIGSSISSNFQKALLIADNHALPLACCTSPSSTGWHGPQHPRHLSESTHSCRQSHVATCKLLSPVQDLKQLPESTPDCSQSCLAPCKILTPPTEPAGIAMPRVADLDVFRTDVVLNGWGMHWLDRINWACHDSFSHYGRV